MTKMTICIQEPCAKGLNEKGHLVWFSLLSRRFSAHDVARYHGCAVIYRLKSLRRIPRFPYSIVG
jgi:hypothetical protein